MAVRLRVFKIPHMNTIVLKQSGGSGFFISTKDSIVISIFGLAALLKYLLISKMLSPKVLEGVLEEYNSYAAELSKIRE